MARVTVKAIYIYSTFNGLCQGDLYWFGLCGLNSFSFERKNQEFFFLFLEKKSFAKTAREKKYWKKILFSTPCTGYIRKDKVWNLLFESILSARDRAFEKPITNYLFCRSPLSYQVTDVDGQLLSCLCLVCVRIFRKIMSGMCLSLSSVHFRTARLRKLLQAMSEMTISDHLERIGIQKESFWIFMMFQSKSVMQAVIS